MAAQALIDGAKAAARGLTDAEAQAVTEHLTTIKSCDEKLEAKARTDSLVADLAATAPASVTTDEPADDARTMGEAFIKSAPYRRFAKENPTGVGQGSPVNIDRVKVGSMEDYFDGRKAAGRLTTDTARLQPTRMPVLVPEYAPRAFLDLISHGSTAGNFEYVQVSAGTRGAAIVPEGELKPVSDLTTTIADAKVYTYADGYEVTNQLLADAPAFASYMDSQLRANLDWVVEDKILNGSGASGEPRGILNTTGVQHATLKDDSPMALVTAIRQAITKVRTLPGGKITGIVISAEDEEKLDLMQDSTGRFFGAGPWSAGPSTLWGYQRTVSDRLTSGLAVVGDLSQVALLDREGLSVVAFNQHKDFAQRNLTYVRAELRAAQVIWRPDRLVVVGK